jgi:hypothetical protein
VVFYSLLTYHIEAWHAAYNYWAVLALEIFAIIFWLSSMAALAAKRATFFIPASVDGCVNYGYGGICYRKRDFATYGYLDMMSASAGLSALEMYVSPSHSFFRRPEISEKA